ncbi:coenzyme F420 hydrogenase subunit beta, partial [Methanophagales archaeon]
MSKTLITERLCTMCGTCVGVCPTDALDVNLRGYPVRDIDRCMNCNLCMEVCPGIGIDMPAFTEKIFGDVYKIENKLGIFKDAYAVSSTNSDLKLNGTSGGFITDFLVQLLETKQIDGAIVTTTSEAHPEKAEVIVAQTKKEILESTQSKYISVSVNQIFREIKKKEGKFALVGLPCHIQGFRKLSAVDPNTAKKIVLTIGLYCGMTMKPKATSDIIKYFKVSPETIQKIEYRGGNWPGEFRILLKNGIKYSLHKDIYRYFFRLYCPERCIYCIDYSNELADISVADAWIVGKNGQWRYPDGKSIVLIRTKTGKHFFEISKKKNSFFLEKLHREVVFESHKGTIRSRKIGSIQRLINSKRELNPDYN